MTPTLCHYVSHKVKFVQNTKGRYTTTMTSNIVLAQNCTVNKANSCVIFSFKIQSNSDYQYYVWIAQAEPVNRKH